LKPDQGKKSLKKTERKQREELWINSKRGGTTVPFEAWRNKKRKEGDAGRGCDQGQSWCDQGVQGETMPPGPDTQKKIGLIDRACSAGKKEDKK